MNTETSAKTGAACAKCHYWSNEGKGDAGQCRRHAPQMIVFNVEKNLSFKSHFPETAASDWCGDFNPK